MTEENSDLLDNMGDSLDKLGKIFKSVSSCFKMANAVSKLKEQVKALQNDAEKIELANSDFNQYKKELIVCYEILTEMDGPTKDLQASILELSKALRTITDKKQMEKKSVKVMKNVIEQVMETAKKLRKMVAEFVEALTRVRQCCEAAITAARKEAENLEKDSSSKKSGGIFCGSSLFGLGASALALGIAGICTGGAAFIAAGAAAVGLGAAMGAGGTAIIAGSLGANEIKEKTEKIDRAIRSLELAKNAVELLEKDAESKTIVLTDDMIQSLQFYLNTMPDEKMTKEKMTKLKNDKRALEDKVAELERQLKEKNEK